MSTEPGQSWEEIGVVLSGGEREKGFIADWDPSEGTSNEARYARQAKLVIEDYRGRGLVRLSTRAYAYKVAADLGVPHTQLKAIGDAIAKARRAEFIEMDAVSDNRTQTDAPWCVDPDDAAEALHRYLDRLVADRQEGQPTRVVLDLEAAGMMPILAALATEYGVTVVSGSGSNPISLTYQLAEDAVDHYLKTGIPTVVLVVTDFDLMGLRNIFVPLARDVEAFAADLGDPDCVEVRRIAATPDQIREHIPANLLQPVPTIKPKNAPAYEVPWWPAEFSLPAAEALAPWLPDIVREAFDHYLPDADLRAELVEGEGELHREAATRLIELLTEDDEDES